MAHPLKDYARAVQDATDRSYMNALAFVQANIATAREGTDSITDPKVRRETVITRLVEKAKSTPAPGARQVHATSHGSSASSVVVVPRRGFRIEVEGIGVIAEEPPPVRRTRPTARPLTPAQLREEMENDTPEAAGLRDDD